MSNPDEASIRSRSHENVSHPSMSPNRENISTTELKDSNHQTDLNQNSNNNELNDFDNRNDNRNRSTSRDRDRSRDSKRSRRRRDRSGSNDRRSRSKSKHRSRDRDRSDSRDKKDRKDRRSNSRDKDDDKSAWKYKGDEIYDPCKLFVGGIPREVDEKKFRRFFEKYGKVADVQIIRDFADKSRGFGFVIMREEEDAKTILSKEIEIEPGRKLDVKQALPKSKTQYLQANYTRPQYYGGGGGGTGSGGSGGSGSGSGSGGSGGSSRYDPASDHHRTRGYHKGYSSRSVEIRDPNRRLPGKIFVGGLPETCTTDDIERYFDKWGTISDSIIMLDGNGRSRRFGFVTFKHVEDMDKCLEEPIHSILHTKVTISKAVPKEEIVPRQTSYYGNNNYDDRSSRYDNRRDRRRSRSRSRSRDKYRSRSRGRRDYNRRSRSRDRRRSRSRDYGRDRRRSRSRDRRY